MSFKPLTEDSLDLIDYPTSGFTIELTRSPTPFYMNTYLPTGLLTLASFIGFVIPVEIVPGRMALLVTTFLMLVNIKSTERYVGPVVSIMRTTFLRHLNKNVVILDQSIDSTRYLAAPEYDLCGSGNL